MNEFSTRTGSLEVICGPMFSGKSEELIRRLKRVQISGKNFLLFKPAIDNRYDENHVISHDMRKLSAVPIGTDKASLKKLEKDVDNAGEFVEIAAFDEANFFDPYIAALSEKWIRQGRRVIAAGLDTTFRAEPFGAMPHLLAIADHVDKLKAICMKCKKEPGTLTQRLVGGKPAKYSDPTIVVGAADSYEARCRNCHEISKE